MSVLEFFYEIDFNYLSAITNTLFHISLFVFFCSADMISEAFFQRMLTLFSDEVM